MKTYVKPMVLANEELAEGVYAASGCWTVTGNLHQVTPENGTDYRFQLSAKHSNEAGHGRVYTITVTFDQPINFKSCQGDVRYISGSGTNTLVLERTNGGTNPNEQVGLGDLIVTYAGVGDAPASISIVGATMTD